VVSHAAPEARGRFSPFRIIALAALLAANGAGAAELVPWAGGEKPALDLDALDGDGVSLADYAGRAVLVHFFATWCEPCVAEMAALERLAGRAEPLVVLAVDVGEVDARVRRFFAGRPVSFPVLMDRDRTATRAWEVVALPTSFVLDADHAVAFFAEGDVAWDDPAADAALGGLLPPPAAVRQRINEGEVEDDEPA
jgi:thiol-disulfide isomerase/thioredoxin